MAYRDPDAAWPDYRDDEQALARIGRWYMQDFALKFCHGPIRPTFALYGHRLRIQMSDPKTGEWVTVDQWCQPVEDA